MTIRVGGSFPPEELFASALTRALEIRGWTRSKLAAEIGKSEQYLGRVMNGRNPCNERMLTACADALGFKVWQLLKLAESA